MSADVQPSTWVRDRIREAVEAEREACARLVEDRESPWMHDHPEEAYVAKLRNIVCSAAIGGVDDDEPETRIAKAVYEFLSTGLDGFDRLFGVQPISTLIRARGHDGA
jgi:hypothetical protein